jgi:hypothetical protein
MDTDDFTPQVVFHRNDVYRQMETETQVSVSSDDYKYLNLFRDLPLLHVARL